MVAGGVLLPTATAVAAAMPVHAGTIPVAASQGATSPAHVRIVPTTFCNDTNGQMQCHYDGDTLD
jgi:hypothetical protein